MAKHVGFRRTTRSTSAAYVPPQAQNPEAPKQAASSNAATSPLSSAVASKISKQETQKVFVCVRVRGGNNGSEDQAFVLDTGRNTIQRTNGSSQNFSCDSVVPPKASTEDLYKKHIRPIVITVLDGYNATVIAFGQTGSGKTYTMMGRPESLGIIPQAINDFFEHIRTDSTGQEYLVSVSYLEIYKDQAKDLLSSSDDSQPQSLAIRHDGTFYAQGLEKIPVGRTQEVLGCIDKGERRRHMEKTDFNERSSRSHCILRLYVESSGIGEHAIARKSHLDLVDLAGTEKRSDGQGVNVDARNAEGLNINTSVSALRNVISALSKQAATKSSGHVKYRDCALTKLLESSLSGNAKIAVICTISPEAKHASESLETLKFAKDAKGVVTRAKRGIIKAQESSIHQNREQSDRLKKQLEAKQAAACQADVQQADSSIIEHDLDKLGEIQTDIDSMRKQLEICTSLNKRILSGVKSANTKSTGDVFLGFPDAQHRSHGPSVKETELEEQVSILQSSLDQHAQQLSEMQTNKDQALADLQRSKDEEVTEIEANVARQLQSLQVRLQEREDEHRKSSQEFQQQIAELQRMRQADQMSHRCLLQAKEGELSQANNNLQLAHSQITVKARVIEDLQSHLSKTQSELSCTVLRNQEVEKQLLEGSNRQAELEKGLASAEQVHQVDQQRISEQIARIHGLEDTEMRQSQDLEQLREDLASVVEKHKAECSALADKHQSESAVLVEKHTETQNRLARAQETINKVANDRDGYISMHDAVVDSLEKSKAKCASLQQQMGDCPEGENDRPPPLGPNGEPSAWCRRWPGRVYKEEVARLAELLTGQNTEFEFKEVDYCNVLLKSRGSKRVYVTARLRSYDGPPARTRSLEYATSGDTEEEKRRKLGTLRKEELHRLMILVYRMAERDIPDTANTRPSIPALIDAILDLPMDLLPTLPIVHSAIQQNARKSWPIWYNRMAADQEKLNKALTQGPKT